MHDAAREFCASHAWLADESGYALDIGGRNINGHCRSLWPKMLWTVIDNLPFDDGIVVEHMHEFICADAREMSVLYDRYFNLVLCTEVFEHCADWPGLVKSAYAALAHGGVFIATCAGPGRSRHSGIDGGDLRKDEHYSNILPHQLGNVAKLNGFRGYVTYNPHDYDDYLYAVKP